MLVPSSMTSGLDEQSVGFMGLKKQLESHVQAA
jgi:hypothetical protein